MKLKTMNILIEKADIQDLLERTDDLYRWLSDNPLADIRLFEKKANQLAILSIKIQIYYKNNL